MTGRRKLEPGEAMARLLAAAVVFLTLAAWALEGSGQALLTFAVLAPAAAVTALILRARERR